MSSKLNSYLSTVTDIEINDDGSVTNYRTLGETDSDNTIRVNMNELDSLVEEHELSHTLENTPGFKDFKNTVLDAIYGEDDIKKNDDINKVKEKYGENADSREKAENEIVAEFVRDEDLLSKISTENKGIINRMLTSLKAKASRLSQSKNSQDAESLKATNELISKFENLVKQNKKMGLTEAIGRGNTDLYSPYIDKNGKVRFNNGEIGKEQGESRYLIYPEFEKQFDRWVEKGKRGDITLKVGTTSDALKSIDVKDQEIIWHTGKINKILNDHPNIDETILKQVPNVIEHPITILKSKQTEGNNRIVVLGEVYDNTNEHPVLAILELEPQGKGKSAILDNIVIASSYAKLESKDSNNKILHTARENLQNLLNDSDILYIEPNKKRTEEWQAHNRVSFPLGTTHSGPIKSITYTDEKSKRKIVYEDENIPNTPFADKLGGIDSIFNDAKNDTGKSKKLLGDEVDIESDIVYDNSNDKQTGVMWTLEDVIDKPETEINETNTITTKIKYSPNGLKLSKSEYAKVHSSISTDYYDKNKTHKGLQYQSCVTDNRHILYVYEDGGFDHYNIVAKVSYGAENEKLIKLLTKEIDYGQFDKITDLVDEVSKSNEFRQSSYSVYNAFTKKRRSSRSNDSLYQGQPTGNTGRINGSGSGYSGNQSRNGTTRTKKLLGEEVIDKPETELNETAKSKGIREKAENKLVRDMSETFSVPLGKSREVLKPLIEDISRGYQETGKMPISKINKLFEEAYNNGVITNDELYNEYSSLRKKLKDTKIKVSNDISKGITDYVDFRKKHIGSLSLNKVTGIEVDSIYEELAAEYPEFFDSEILNPADRLLKIAEVSDDLKIKTEALKDKFKTPEERRTFKVEFNNKMTEFIESMRNVKRFNDALPNKAEINNSSIKVENGYVTGNFNDVVDSVFKGDVNERLTVKIGNTPKIIRDYGADDNPLTISQSEMYKIAYPQGYLGLKQGHNLGIPALKHLPEQIADPVAILKSNTQKDKGRVILTEWNDKNNKPVIIALHINQNGAVEVENVIKSAYGKNNIEALLGKNNENVIYTKNNEDIHQLLTVRLQLPEANTEDIFNNNLSQNEEIVNNNSMQESENNTETVQRAYDNLYSAKKKADKVMSELPLTESDKHSLDGLLKGSYTLDDLPKSSNPELVKQAYEAKKEVYDNQRIIDEHRKAVREKYDAEAESFIADSDNWKDKKRGLSYATETAYRNFLDVSKGDKGFAEEYINKAEINDGNKTRFIKFNSVLKSKFQNSSIFMLQ